MVYTHTHLSVVGVLVILLFVVARFFVGLSLIFLGGEPAPRGLCLPARVVFSRLFENFMQGALFLGLCFILLLVVNFHFTNTMHANMHTQRTTQLFYVQACTRRRCTSRTRFISW
jgi:hypothetical protein